MVPYGPRLSCMAPYGLVWSPIVPYFVVWSHMVLYGPAWSSKQGAHNGPICRKRSFKWPYLILWSNIGPPFAWKVRYVHESQINQYFLLKWRKNSKYLEMQRLSLSECYVVDEDIHRRSRNRRKCFKRVKRPQSWNRAQERRGGNINAGFTISGTKVRFFGQILVRYSPKK